MSASSCPYWLELYLDRDLEPDGVFVCHPELAKPQHLIRGGTYGTRADSGTTAVECGFKYTRGIRAFLIAVLYYKARSDGPSANASPGVDLAGTEDSLAHCLYHELNPGNAQWLKFFGTNAESSELLIKRVVEAKKAHECYFVNIKPNVLPADRISVRIDGHGSDPVTDPGLLSSFANLILDQDQDRKGKQEYTAPYVQHSRRPTLDKIANMARIPHAGIHGLSDGRTVVDPLGINKKRNPGVPCTWEQLKEALQELALTSPCSETFYVSVGTADFLVPWLDRYLTNIVDLKRNQVCIDRVVVKRLSEPTIIRLEDQGDMVKCCGWRHDQAATFLTPSAN